MTRSPRRCLAALCCSAALVLFCSGCSIFTVLSFIPTLFAAQSRLEGCASGSALSVGQFVQLTFVVVQDDGSTTPVDQGLEWTVRDGAASIDDAAVNPVFVELTTPGIVTVQAEYPSEDMAVNPAICTMFVREPADPMGESGG